MKNSVGEQMIRRPKELFGSFFLSQKHFFMAKTILWVIKVIFRSNHQKNEESTFTEWVSLNMITENVLSHLVDDYT